MVDLAAKNHDDLISFYIEKCADEPSLFHVWENGGSRGDSVTPSTYSVEYRTWMADRLAAALDLNAGGLLSLGCGNAAVEAEVVRRGYDVLAIDAMPEAVALAQAKGVDAVCADIYAWEPGRTWSVAYIDGVLGHLYEPVGELGPVLSRIRSWLTPRSGSCSGRATLIASNDAPQDGSAVQQALGVDGFHWLSADFIGDQATAAGFLDVASDSYVYSRPLSGQRIRSVVTGHIAQ
ncbi:MAG: hypothetical protein QOE97_1824 [Pseudonocardiales bacterium]|jgi:SAM-dependent methyltransferase|nr:hypothetical protein [Pseudonocardiales bacterium]